MKMKFKDIPQIPHSYYRVNYPWKDLDYSINRFIEQYKLDLDPDFQRDYVWTIEQKIAFVEWGLRGGESGMDLYFNHPGWMDSFKGEFSIIDGKQRLSAVMEFLNNKVPAFGYYLEEYEDQMHSMNPFFNINILKLKTRKEILNWYIAMNTGGSIHTSEEIERVKQLLEET